MNQKPTINLQQVAHLARLELSAAEEAEFAPQLAHILEYVAALDSLDVSTLEPTAHANPVFDVTREDAARPGFGVENALRNAPRSAQEQFVVPRVVE